MALMILMSGAKRQNGLPAARATGPGPQPSGHLRAVSLADPPTTWQPSH